MSSAATTPRREVKVCIVGPSTRFLSGISYYTYDLARALATRLTVCALLMRRLLPTGLYPGSNRVGNPLTDIEMPADVETFDGIDWYWGGSMWRALRFLKRERPDVLVFQWWTATVLHSYLLLALVARTRRARIVIEFHEVLDTGEQRLRIPFLYARMLAPRLFALASEFVVHSEADRELVVQHFGVSRDAVTVVPHAVYDVRKNMPPVRDAPETVCNMLYFGVIRQYKGLDVLVRAFSTLPPETAERFWLTIVGEIWEGCVEPRNLIAQSPYRERITYVERYVDDQELAAFLGGADVVVLPYRRSSQSGPLHLAMGCGLPVVVTAVGGLVEAARDYAGAVFVEPEDVADLTAGILRAAKLNGQRYAAPSNWADTADAYCKIVSRVTSAGNTKKALETIG
jgi:glycosyltransferase involved in cell wall biosynthesis